MSPSGIDLGQDGKVYVADTFNDRVQAFTIDPISGSVTGVAVFGESGIDPGTFNGPMGIAVSETYFYVADTYNHRIQQFGLDGAFIRSWGSYGTGNGQFKRPAAAAIDENNLWIYIADSLNHRVQKFDLNGSWLSTIGGPGSGSLPGQFNNPSGLAVDQAGNLYVADTLNHRIQKFDKNGSYLTHWGEFGSGPGQFSAPRGVAVDSAGMVFAADTGNQRIQKFDANGALAAVFGSAGTGNGQFDSPYAVTAGEEDVIFVIDRDNNRVQGFQPNHPPTDILLSGNSIPEGRPAGTLVGVFTTSDPDPVDSHTYTLVNTAEFPDNTLFDISGNQLTAKSVFDYESGDTHFTIRVRSTDYAGVSVEKSFELLVADGNERPILYDATFTLPENSASGIVAGTLTGYDSTPAEELAFSIISSSAPGGLEVVKTGTQTAELRVLNPAPINYEAYADHLIRLTVEVRDPDGLSDTADVTIVLQQANDPPTISAPGSPYTIAENSPEDALVGSLVITDEDGDTFTVSDNHSDFKIVQASGSNYNILVDSIIDYEDTASYAYTITAKDSKNAIRTLTVTINVTPIDEPPYIADTAVTISENRVVPYTIGSNIAYDPEGSKIECAILSGNLGNTFVMVPYSSNSVQSCRIQAVDNTLLDYEYWQTQNPPNFVLRVRACEILNSCEGEGCPQPPPVPQCVEGDVKVSVTNVNEPPVLNVIPLSIEENSASGTVVAAITAANPETTQTLTYSITQISPACASTPAAFSITSAANQGVLRVNNNALLNYEALRDPLTGTAACQVTIRVSDGTATDTDPFTVEITNANDPPVVTVNPSAVTIAEHTSDTAPLSVAAYTDEDGNTASFSITGGNSNDVFQIDELTGAIRIAKSALLDFETTPVFHLQITATDNGAVPANGSGSFDVTLTGINEPPVVNQAEFGVIVNSPNGTVVGSVTAADPDAGAVLTYAITGGSGQTAFQINPATGQITVKDTTQIKMTNSPFSLVVRATDNTGLSGSGTITIVVNPLPDLAVTAINAPSQVLTGTNLIYEIVIENLTSTESAPFMVQFPLPEGVTLNAATSSPECLLNSSRIFTCQEPALPGLGRLTINADVQLTRAVADGAGLSTFALLTTNGADLTPGNNTRNSTINVKRSIVVTNLDFESGTGAGWPPGVTTSQTPTGARKFLGELNNGTYTYTLTNLLAHYSVEVSFDLYILRSWDGNGPNGPDRWKFQVENGPYLLDTTFSNWGENSFQSYPDPYIPENVISNNAFTGAAESHTLGYRYDFINNMDSVYRLNFTFQHTNPTLVLKFIAENLQGQYTDGYGFTYWDESWGIDNLTIKIKGQDSFSVYLPIISAK